MGERSGGRRCGGPTLPIGGYASRGCRRAAITALILSLGAVFGPAGAAHATATCKPRGAEPYASSGKTRVWLVRYGRPGAGLYACDGARRRSRFFLGERVDAGSDGVRALDVNGRYVAYEDAGCDRASDTCLGAIRVRNIRTRHVRTFRIPDGQSFAFQVLVFSDGSAAWMRRIPAGGAEVRAADAQGERLLASGPTVTPFSLARSFGRRLYWTEGDQPRVAVLARRAS